MPGHADMRMRVIHCAGLAATFCFLVLPPALAAVKEDPLGHSTVDTLDGRKFNKRPAIKTPFPEIQDWSTLKISLSRGPSLGACPVYSVEIRGDGAVIYYGKQFVAEKTGRVDKIPVEAVRGLVDSFRQAEFLWLFDGYNGGLSDSPSRTVSISFDNVVKSVRDQMGGMAGLPPEAQALEVKIDEVAGTAKWIVGASDAPPKCR